MSQFVVYCDESKKKGRYFSNFYGGALLRESDRLSIASDLDALKCELNLGREVKWTRITENYRDKYISLIQRFFDHVEADKIKLRIMFTQNAMVPVGLTDEHLENEYFILYYQFLKHAFGLQYAGIVSMNVATYLDTLPHGREKVDRFKSYLHSLGDFPPFREKKIVFPREDIADVDSRDHVILQCLDVVLGAMQFRLNDQHLEKSKDSRVRGKRTRAKEEVYTVISRRIRAIHLASISGFQQAVPTDIRTAGHIDIATGFSRRPLSSSTTGSQRTRPRDRLHEYR